MGFYSNGGGVGWGGINGGFGLFIDGSKIKEKIKDMLFDVNNGVAEELGLEIKVQLKLFKMK